MTSGFSRPPGVKANDSGGGQEKSWGRTPTPSANRTLIFFCQRNYFDKYLFIYIGPSAVLRVVCVK